MVEEKKTDLDTLTSEQQFDIITRLQEKWGHKYKCECCGSEKFQIQAHIVSPPIFGVGFVLGGKAYPYIQASCLNCGNTKFINAVLLGFSNPFGGKDVE